MFLAKIKQYIQKNKKTFIYIWFIILVFSLSTDWVFAVDTSANKEQEMIKTVINIVNWIITFISVILWVISYLVALFLSPWWYNWSFFNLDEHFRSLWILISNLVYFIFAFLLIWIAFMNIIWKEWENYQLKQVLPKFVIWVLIVPFSWFFVQFVLSISSLLTVAALTLPSNTFPEFSTQFNQIKVPTECTIDLTNESESNDAFKCETVASLKDLISWNNDSTVSIFWIISTYTHWIMKLDLLNDFSKDTYIKGINDLWTLLVKLFFDLFFIIVFWVLMLVLWLVLLVRWIYIWMYIIFSPAFWLLHFFGSEKWWEIAQKYNIKQFISLAMVPVYSMLALSFWLLFMYVIWTWMVSEWTNYDGIKLVEKDGNTKISIWDSSLTIKWALWNSSSWSGSNNGVTLDQIMGSPLWVVWTLIMYMFSIMVLWLAIMAALRSSEVTKTITEPIYNFGKQVWWLAVKAPMYAPVFGKGQSMASLTNIGSRWVDYMKNKPNLKASEFIADKWLFWQSWELARIITANKNKVESKEKNQVVEWIRNMTFAWKNTRQLADNSDYVAALKKAMEEFGVIQSEIGKVKVWNRQSVFDWLQALEGELDIKRQFWSIFKLNIATWEMTGISVLDRILSKGISAWGGQGGTSSATPPRITLQMNKYNTLVDHNWKLKVEDLGTYTAVVEWVATQLIKDLGLQSLKITEVELRQIITRDLWLNGDELNSVIDKIISEDPDFIK